MTTENINDLLAQLRAREAQLTDGEVIDSPQTRARFADYWALRRELAATIGGLMNLPDQLARAQQKLDDLESRRAVVVAKQAELETALAEAPPWREHPDARERDRRFDHIEHLRRALEHLHNGTLWAGNLKDGGASFTIRLPVVETASAQARGKNA